MDFMSTVQVLGNLGEFFGAIVVVITLLYLAAQVRQGRASLDANTRALQEQRRLALAQAYQNRTQLIQQHLLQIQNSDYMPAILSKVFTDGTEAVSEEERIRLRYGALTILNQLDNLHFQHAQGFLDDETYEYDFKAGVRRQAPLWQQLDLAPRRPTFRDEVEKVLRES